MRITTMEAEVLLEALPAEDCRFDHNRDCQEHGYFGIDGNCPVAESKELISTALKAPLPAEPAKTTPEKILADLEWMRDQQPMDNDAQSIRRAAYNDVVKRVRDLIAGCTCRAGLVLPSMGCQVEGHDASWEE